MDSIFNILHPPVNAGSTAIPLEPSRKNNGIEIKGANTILAVSGVPLSLRIYNKFSVPIATESVEI